MGAKQREFLGAGSIEERPFDAAEMEESLAGFLSSSSSSSSSSKSLGLRREGLRGRVNWMTLLGLGFGDGWDLGGGREENMGLACFGSVG